jgi:hypothetical protein
MIFKVGDRVRVLSSERLRGMGYSLTEEWDFLYGGLHNWRIADIEPSKFKKGSYVICLEKRDLKTWVTDSWLEYEIHTRR